MQHQQQVNPHRKKMMTEKKGKSNGKLLLNGYRNEQALESLGSKGHPIRTYWMVSNWAKWIQW